MTQSHSITNRTLLLVGLICGALLLLGTAGVYGVTYGEATRNSLASVERYGALLAQRENQKFTDLAEVQTDAVSQLKTVMSQKDADGPLSAANEALFDTLFPLRGDGTRRSIAGLYEGMVMANGDYVDGIVGYIRDGKTISDVRKKAYLAAFHVVHLKGRRIDTSLQNFFYNSPQTDLILYMPGFPSAAEFFRNRAPNSLDITTYPHFMRVTPAQNPTRAGVCVNMLQVTGVAVLNQNTTVCQTPFYQNDTFFGSFGSTLTLSQLYKKNYGHAVPSYDVALISSEQVLVAAPRFLTDDGWDAQFQKISAFEIPTLKQLPRLLQRSASANQATDMNDTYLMSINDIGWPNWKMVVFYPQALVAGKAWDQAKTVFFSGIVGLLVLCLLVSIALRVGVGGPLDLLIAEMGRFERLAQAKGDAPNTLNLPVTRKDEIGTLARSFEAMSQSVLNAQKDLKGKVDQRTSAFQAEKVKAEFANRAKTQFVASMSHELRTPLNAIVGFAEILRDEAAQDSANDASGHLEHLLSSAAHLRQLVDDVLDFAQLDADSLDLLSQPTDIAACVVDACRLTQSQAKASNIRVLSQQAADAQYYVDAEHGRLVQVIVNLISNAIKFNDDAGDVYLEIKQIPGERIRLHVRDTGPGIPADQLDKIFDPFERFHGTGNSIEGAGIGLSLCNQLVSAMNGQIGVQSAVGDGSDFWVEFPLSTSTAELAHAITA